MSSVSLINGHIDDDTPVEVIRCKDCVYCHGRTCVSIFSGVLYSDHPNYYCGYGERRDT